jgi:hypothetical protein
MTRPKQSFEAKRLVSTEEDWNLVTASGSLSRTRGGGNGRPNVERARQRKESMFIEEIGPEDVVEVAESITTAASVTVASLTSSEGTSRRSSSKPNHSRIILEVDHIEKVFDELGCPKCGGPIKTSLRTVCISSRIGFECIDRDCGFSHNAEEPSTTTIHADSKYNERSTDYAINVLYFLGFISAAGDECTEAARMLGVLGLPNDTTMESRSFTIIEERLVPLLGELLHDILRENLIAEVKAYQ